jgi:hypothetical protein
MTHNRPFSYSIIEFETITDSLRVLFRDIKKAAIGSRQMSYFVSSGTKGRR